MNDTAKSKLKHLDVDFVKAVWRQITNSELFVETDSTMPEGPEDLGPEYWLNQNVAIWPSSFSHSPAPTISNPTPDPITYEGWSVARMVMRYNFPHAPDEGDYVDESNHLSEDSAIHTALVLLLSISLDNTIDMQRQAAEQGQGDEAQLVEAQLAVLEEQELEDAQELDPINDFNLKSIHIALRDLGVAEVRCTYNGGGDSGVIEDPEFVDSNNNAVAEATAVLIPGRTSQYNLDTKEHEIKEEHMLLSRVVIFLVSDLINSEHMGWEINEGSEGTFTLDVKSGIITLEHLENCIAQKHHHHTFKASVDEPD